jgi:hypothetical protein
VCPRVSVLCRPVSVEALRRADPPAKGIEGEGEDWMHLALDRDQWRDIVNTIMNLRVLQGAAQKLAIVITAA